MQNLKFLLVALFLVSLTGCSLLHPSPPNEPQLPPEPSPAPPPKIPQGTAKELFRNGVNALQYGDTQRAKTLLQQVLILEPNHKNAASLLAQIDADPVKMLGKENFLYKVQQDDTLSLIAQRFLGDPYKFYILGRYNDMTTFDSMEAGRSIKIPGKKPPSYTPEQLAPPASPSPGLSEAEIRSYEAEAKKLTDAGKYDEAKQLLSNGLEKYPGDERLSRQLNRVEIESSAQQSYQEGNRLAASGDLERAYGSYAYALKLNPDHAEARAALARIKPQLVEMYYAEAVRARRQQEYDTALRSLDKLLAIEPNHKLGLKNRAEIEAIRNHEKSGR
jgi:tetratricopeptide (TPR) repeat protein